MIDMISNDGRIVPEFIFDPSMNFVSFSFAADRIVGVDANDDRVRGGH